MKSHKNEKIHFVGVGGVSMSALAKFVAYAGGQVTGSDRERSATSVDLEKIFPVYYGEHPEIVDGCDKIIYSSAIALDNLEMKRANELKIPAIERRDFLGQIADLFERTVAVAGTHGKTTVTAMISHSLKKLDCNFSAHIGGETEYGNLILCGTDVFVTEACEYKKSLLSLNPHISVVLNAELDHPDCYEDMQSLLNVYLTFLEKGDIQVFTADFVDTCKNEHMNISHYEKMATAVKNLEEKEILSKDDVIVFSNGKMKIWSKVTSRIIDGNPKMSVYENGGYSRDISLPDLDETTEQNALVTMAVIDALGVAVDKGKDTLATFKGVKRRREFVGCLGGAKVVFDYAHHPTQIETVVKAYKGKNLVVFQPHTYTRTKAYFDGFVSALSLADKVLVMDTYGARESAIDGADSISLAEQISTIIAKERVEYVKNADKTIEYVINAQNEFDNILFLGAGDIYLLKGALAPYLK